MKQRAEAGTQRKALDLWDAPQDSGDGLVCVATTYTFDATFFETECLGRFLRMQTHPSESESVGYLIEREEKLAAARVCALVDRRHSRNKESLRWDVLGVLVPRAIQHAKISILAWANHVRVIIGSGNLTVPGYRRNLEVFGCIDYSKLHGGDRTGVRQSLEFVGIVLEHSVGATDPDTPRARAEGGLKEISRRISSWPTENSERAYMPLFGYPGNSVLKTMEEHWPDNGPPRKASIVSPFFDRPDNSAATMESLIRLLAKRGSREVYLSVRTEDRLDGTKRVFAPLQLVHAARNACDPVEVYSVNPTQNDELRQLHAKLLLLENDRWCSLLIGSSNFTAAGLGTRPSANLEANLLYRFRQGSKTAKRISDVWPQVGDVPIDVTDKNLAWDPEPEELEDGGDSVPLPAPFCEVLFVAGEDQYLLITLADGLPAKWSIRVPDGEVILSSEREFELGPNKIPWIGNPPFVLEVTWEGASGFYVSGWPVNVANPATLPPPDELKNLSLEELLAILSSTRPLHEAVARVIRLRKASSSGEQIIDPLKRFDSPDMLLRRTKRVGAAIDQLRERLERPVSSAEAYEWRLQGPVGPLALAKAFSAEARLEGEASFYLAELALAIGRVRPRVPAEGGLSVVAIRSLLGALLNDIVDLSTRINSMAPSSPLGRYITSAFLKAKGA